MSRALLAVFVALGILALSSSPAAAGRDWCDDDPVIHVGAQTAHAVTGFASRYLPSLSGPLEYVIVVPSSVASRTWVDTSAASLPTVASVSGVADRTFHERYGDKADLVVIVRVPARQAFMTLTTVSSGNSVEWRHGRSDRWITIAFSFAG